jgi:putative membrane protein
MKTKIISIASTLFIMSAMLGCNQKPHKLDNNAAETAETPGDEKRKNSQTNEEAEKNVTLVGSAAQDKDFARQAAEAGLTEVKLGRLAAERGKQPAVREFGEMMIKDHSAANQELKAIADKKGITLPNESNCSECQPKYDQLVKHKGAEFDKAYMDMMVKGHKEVAEKFSKESSGGADADLKAFAAKTLPIINHHLGMAESLQKTTAMK